MGAETTARVASVVFALTALVLVILWLRGLPADRKFRTGIYRWRE